jgi:hypothetical protein
MTLIRAAAVLVAVLVSPAISDAAQGLTKSDASDFQMFLHSIAVRRNAAVCEGRVREYGKAFGDLYARWAEKHREAIARGESLFNEALTSKDPKRYPYIAPATLARVEQGLAELARPRQPSGPTPPAAQTAATCEKVLTFLKQG